MYYTTISSTFYVREFKIGYRARQQLSLCSKKIEIKCFQNNRNLKNEYEHINVKQKHSTKPLEISQQN